VRKDLNDFLDEEPDEEPEEEPEEELDEEPDEDFEDELDEDLEESDDDDEHSVSLTFELRASDKLFDEPPSPQCPLRPLLP
jgi:exosome complex component RRP41